jgi:hypothetical protein
MSLAGLYSYRAVLDLVDRLSPCETTPPGVKGKQAWVEWEDKWSLRQKFPNH